ncbi:MAG: RNA polymerase sigma-70 factor, partial [Bacteroidota bacterium]
DDILTRLKADERSALQELFQQHYPSVCRTIYRFVQEKNMVEDLAQEVFIRIWEKRHQLEIKTSIGAYINRMAINEAIAHFRKQKRRQMDPELTIKAGYGNPTISSEDLYMGKELKVQVTEAINSLPPRCRTIFQLSRFEELSYREIAERLDISIKTVENQMGKALKILRELLKGYLCWLWLSHWAFLAQEASYQWVWMDFWV